MGCLNADSGFSHWFGNIHLSGHCNRACYFCIGQHMMALDAENNLDVWPLLGLDDFLRECQAKGVREVNLTGTNTDPMLYRHMMELTAFLRAAIPGVTLGIRTNGIAILQHPERWAQFDKASITVESLEPAIYRAMMGRGNPPDIEAILRLPGPRRLKANIVLGPENILGCPADWWQTAYHLSEMGITEINLREPYGQPRIGNPFSEPGWEGIEPDGHIHGMPFYKFENLKIVYWDVHYCEVESVNLYASGRVSLTYPITKGHADTGEVKDQSHFPHPGRQRAQWVSYAQMAQSARPSSGGSHPTPPPPETTKG